jgi:PPOX class probable F420-dependent enzyme
MPIPTKYQDLVSDTSKAMLYLATLMPDGSPQVTPVWFSVDGDTILINTNEGRLKDKNMRARKQVAMTIQDPNERYRYIGIRGEVVGHTYEGAVEHIEMLSMRYDDKPWGIRKEQKRIIYKIKPTHVHDHE